MYDWDSQNLGIFRRHPNVEIMSAHKGPIVLMEQTLAHGLNYKRDKRILKYGFWGRVGRPCVLVIFNAPQNTLICDRKETGVYPPWFWPQGLCLSWSVALDLLDPWSLPCTSGVSQVQVSGYLLCLKTDPSLEIFECLSGQSFEEWKMYDLLIIKGF